MHKHIVHKKKSRGSLLKLYKEVEQWDNNLRLIKKEQKYLIEQLSFHFLEIANAIEFKKVKLYISGLEYELNTLQLLRNEIIEHKNNLSILLMGVSLKNETLYRLEHQKFFSNYENYKSNFLHIYKQATALILKIISSKLID